MRQDNLASLYMCPQQSKNTSGGVCVQPVLAACKRLMVADRDKHQPQSKSAFAVCGTGLAWQMRQDNLASLYMCPQQSKNTSRGVCVQPVLAACKRLMVADRDKHQPQSKSAFAVCGTGLAWQNAPGQSCLALYVPATIQKYKSWGLCATRACCLQTAHGSWQGQASATKQVCFCSMWHRVGVAKCARTILPRFIPASSCIAIILAVSTKSAFSS